MMNYWLQRIKTSNSQNDQRAIEQWKWVRDGGQARFVIRTTLVFSLAMMIGDELTEGGAIGLFDIISAHLVGLMMGLFVWWGMESRYKNACRQGRLNATPTGEIPENPYLSLNSK